MIPIRNYYLGLYSEEYKEGVLENTYDIVFNAEGGVRARNLNDYSKIIRERLTEPLYVNTETKELGKHLENLNESEYGKNVYWYSQSSISDNVLFRPFKLEDGDIVVRVRLRDWRELGVTNCLIYKNGRLEGYELNGDDLILVAGLGIDKTVSNVSRYLELIKRVM